MLLVPMAEGKVRKFYAVKYVGPSRMSAEDREFYAGRRRLLNVSSHSSWLYGNDMTQKAK